MKLGSEVIQQTFPNEAASMTTGAEARVDGGMKQAGKGAPKDGLGTNAVVSHYKGWDQAVTG
jgi:hypothetical protein